MRYGIFPALLVALLLQAAAIAAEPADAVSSALEAALQRNVAHAREWLDQKDFKSVAQSAGGLQLLADLLKARSDDAAWQAAIANVTAAVSSVQSAAREEDTAKCKSALESLEKASSAAASRAPTGKPQPLARAPAIRPLMLTLDAMQGDAKIAVLTGNVEAARKQAYVLAELGKLVSNSKNTDQWTSLAGEFARAATVATTCPENDAKAMRQHFRVIAESCEACHEKNRTR
jgi:hypothetical protein